MPGSIGRRFPAGLADNLAAPRMASLSPSPPAAPMRCWSHRGGPIGSVSRGTVPRGGTRLARELDEEGEPPIRICGGTDRPAVRLDDRAADRQTHAEPPGLRAH